MLSFRKHIQEVAEPKAGDEKRFKDKHVVAVTDYPGSDDDSDTQNMTKKSPAKKKRLADMDQAEAEKVYEENMMKCEDCGEEYDADEGEHECEMDEEKMTDDEMKKREEIVKGMKDKEADLKKRYGDRWKAVMYATATKKAMEEGVAIKVTKTAPKIVKEDAVLDEAFKVGAMKLKDGSSVKLAKEDVQALDNLYKNLNSSNRKKMQEKLEANKKSFGEILAFAKQAM